MYNVTDEIVAVCMKHAKTILKYKRQDMLKQDAADFERDFIRVTNRAFPIRRSCVADTIAGNQDCHHLGCKACHMPDLTKFISDATIILY